MKPFKIVLKIKTTPNYNILNQHLFNRRTGSGRHPSGGETSGEGSVRPGGTHPPQLPAATQQVRQAPPPPPLPENGVGLRNRTAVLR